MLPRHRSISTSLTLLAFLLVGATLEAQGRRQVPPVDRTILRAGVHVLDERALRSLVYVSPDGATLVFRGPLGRLHRIMGGDVIVGGTTARTPQGLLRRVTDVSGFGRQLTLTTEPATLEDVFWSGSVRRSFRISRADISRIRPHARGVHVRRTGEESGIRDLGAQQQMNLAAPDLTWTPPPIEVDLLDVILFDLDEDPATTDDQVTLSGKAGVTPTFAIELDVSWGRVQRFSFTNSNELHTELELDGHVFVPVLDEDVTLATIQFSPIIIMAGPVPLVFTPIVDINAGARGSLTAEVHSRVSAVVPVSAGIVYENRRWSGFTDLPTLEEIEVDWEPPDLLAEAYAQAYVGPRGSFLLYGLAGPFAEVHGYSELSAMILPSPTWTLYLGIRGNIGLEDSFSIIGPEFTLPVFDRKWEIAEGAFVPF